jgi:hypothetical protein
VPDAVDDSVGVTVLDGVSDLDTVCVAVRDFEDDADEVLLSDAEVVTVCEPLALEVAVSVEVPDTVGEREGDPVSVRELLSDSEKLAVSVVEEETLLVNVVDMVIEAVCVKESDGLNRVWEYVADGDGETVLESVVVTVRLGVIGGVIVLLSDTLGNVTDVALNDKKDIVKLGEFD